MSVIKTPPSTKEYEEGWERVFGKKREREKDTEICKHHDGIGFVCDPLTGRCPICNELLMAPNFWRIKND